MTGKSDLTEKTVVAIVKACYIEKGRYADEGAKLGESFGGTLGTFVGAANADRQGKHAHLMAVASAPVGALVGRAMGWSAGKDLEMAESAYHALKPKVDKIVGHFKGSSPVPALSAGTRTPSTKMPRQPKAGAGIKSPKPRVEKGTFANVGERVGGSIGSAVGGAVGGMATGGIATGAARPLGGAMGRMQGRSIGAGLDAVASVFKKPKTPKVASTSPKPRTGIKTPKVKM